MGRGQVPSGGVPGGSQQRPLAVVEGVVLVDDTETVLAVANPARRDVIIQNNGPAIVQIYLTTGLGFALGGIQLTPGSSTVAGDVWSAAQPSGIVTGAIYARCNTGQTTNVSVTKES